MILLVTENQQPTQSRLNDSHLTRSCTFQLVLLGYGAVRRAMISMGGSQDRQQFAVNSRGGCQHGVRRMKQVRRSRD